MFREAVDQVQSIEDAISLAIELRAEKSDADWMYGDLANRVVGMRRNNELFSAKTATIKYFAGQINEPYNKIKDAARVSRIVPHTWREQYPDLVFGHWREIVKRGHHGEQALAWAEKASDQGLSVTALRIVLEGKAPKDPRLQLLRRIIYACDELEKQGLDGVDRVYRDELLEAKAAAKKFVDLAQGEWDARPGNTRRVSSDGRDSGAVGEGDRHGL